MHLHLSMTKNACDYFVTFPSRDTLKRNYNLGGYYLDIDLGDLTSYDETLAEKLQKQPTEHLPIVSY